MFFGGTAIWGLNVNLKSCALIGKKFVCRKTRPAALFSMFLFFLEVLFRCVR